MESSIAKWPLVVVWIVSILGALLLAPVALLAVGASGDTTLATITIKLVALLPLVYLALAITSHVLYAKRLGSTKIVALLSVAFEIVVFVLLMRQILTMSFT